jgi:hypothetical protein
MIFSNSYDYFVVIINTQMSICSISQTMIFSNCYDYFEAIINTQLSICSISQTKQKGYVTHTVALPYTFKKYLKAKEEEEEELWKIKYNFTMQK